MVFQFNQFILDTNRYQLSLSGKPISIEPLVFDLLAYLIEHRDRVVTREELLDNLWKGKVVTDAALSARLKDARKVVHDNGTKQAVIKTIHGRGYQFIADVGESEADHSKKKPEVSNFCEDLSLSSIPSIVVLPFRNLSGDPEQKYFSDGITEDIITELSRFRDVIVIARHSAFQY
jgi:DNA-binding winged helix-turn-helix (wHTH) protein